MRILADEHIPRGVVVALRTAGHDVVWAVETGRRASDRDHMASADGSGRAILTEDTDFAKLAHEAEMQDTTAPAVMLVRLRGMPRKRKVDHIVEAVAELGPQPSSRTIHVIEASRIRSRLLRRDYS